eukprot:3700432-Prymnesium_polylepis.1
MAAAMDAGGSAVAQVVKAGAVGRTGEPVRQAALEAQTVVMAAKAAMVGEGATEVAWMELVVSR